MHTQLSHALLSAAPAGGLFGGSSAPGTFRVAHVSLEVPS